MDLRARVSRFWQTLYNFLQSMEEAAGHSELDDLRRRVENIEVFIGLNVPEMKIDDEGGKK
jgi:hypothetical protein